MAETTQENSKAGSRRNTKIGYVVSTRMQKTIVVETTKQKSHRMYVRVISRSKKFYAHDEQNSARVGDVVRIEETRPLSKTKRWRLKDVIRRATLVPQVDSATLSGEEKAS
jgi:small subunit ribosomal protein S17